MKSLIEAGKELRCSNLLVITYDHEGEEKFNGKNVTVFAAVEVASVVVLTEPCPLAAVRQGRNRRSLKPSLPF